MGEVAPEEVSVPVYVYERPDGSRFELRQGFTDASLTEDPETGVAVRRVLQPAPIIFKGSGWYKTDSRPTTSDASATSTPAKAEDGSGDTAGKGEKGDTAAATAPTTKEAVSEATAKVGAEVKAATGKTATSEKPTAKAAAKSTSTPAAS